MVASIYVSAKGGFSFDLCPRNGMLELHRNRYN